MFWTCKINSTFLSDYWSVFMYWGHRYWTEVSLAGITGESLQFAAYWFLYSAEKSLLFFVSICVEIKDFLFFSVDIEVSSKISTVEYLNQGQRMNHWEIKTTRVKSAACMTFKSITEMAWLHIKRVSHLQVCSFGRFSPLGRCCCRSAVCVHLDQWGHSDWFVGLLWIQVTVTGKQSTTQCRQPEYRCLTLPPLSVSLCYLSPCFFPRFNF